MNQAAIAPNLCGRMLYPFVNIAVGLQVLCRQSAVTVPAAFEPHATLCIEVGKIRQMPCSPAKFILVVAVRFPALDRDQSMGSETGKNGEEQCSLRLTEVSGGDFFACQLVPFIVRPFVRGDLFMFEVRRRLSHGRHRMLGPSRFQQTDCEKYCDSRNPSQEQVCKHADQAGCEWHSAGALLRSGVPSEKAKKSVQLCDQPVAEGRDRLNDRRRP